MSRIIAIVLGIVVGIGVLWGGGWLIYRANLDQQNQANHQSQQYQDAIIQAERDRVQGYMTATDEGQKKQILMTYCAVYKSITHPESAPDLVSFSSANC